MGFDTKDTLIDKLNELKMNCAEVLNGIDTMLTQYEDSVLVQDGELTEAEDAFLECLDEFDEPLDFMMEQLEIAQTLCDTAVMENEQAEE